MFLDLRAGAFGWRVIVVLPKSGRCKRTTAYDVSELRTSVALLEDALGLGEKRVIGVDTAHPSVSVAAGEAINS